MVRHLLISSIAINAHGHIDLFNEAYPVFRYTFWWIGRIYFFKSVSNK